jgi:ABC-type bacteriocin/lantibiotic exporter with double-glycine peptidase domain
MMSDKPNKITATRVFAAGTVLALVISIPAIVVTLVMHYFIKTNLIVTMVTSVITLFIAMGFGYKLSKKLTTKVQYGSSDDSQDLEKMK